MKAFLIVPLITLACLGASPARDLHVDPVSGADNNDGVSKPVLSIAKAIRLAEPGDTIHLQATTYYEYAGFHNKKGTAGKPITLDGHGAILEGSDPIDPASWTEVMPGLFKSDSLMPALNRAILWRWFFLMDGKINRMGRVMKGKSDPFKKPEELKAGEWTFVEMDAPTPVKSDSQKMSGSFYIKLKPRQTLEQAKIRYPLRSGGVLFSGDNAHLIIRNLTATHPYNDGFNIHGDCRDVVFANIRAIECGDDGISAHETAQYRVDGLESIGNATGICDTGGSETSYHNVFIADCVGVDLYFLDSGRYSIRNAVVLSSAQKPFVVTGSAKGSCTLHIDNLFIRRLGTPQPALIGSGSTVLAKRLTLENQELTITGKAGFEDCLVNGQARPPHSKNPGADIKQLSQTLVPESYKTQFQ